ncbi:hypothetical protein PM082_000003 [Marasmius tenuissimus]|nr:hypothetical protein PM082_000003 [Marasmius tenuissimus]
MPYPTYHDDTSLSDMDTAWGDEEEVDELDTDSEPAIGDVGGEEESVGIIHGQRGGVLSITLSNSKLEVRVGSEFATLHIGLKLAGMTLLLVGIIGLALQDIKLDITLHIGVGAAGGGILCALVCSIFVKQLFVRDD